MEPSTPQTLEELVQHAEEIPIFTVGVAWHMNLDSKLEIGSYMTETVIPQIVANGVTTLNNRKLEMYNCLQKVVRTALDSSYDLVTDYLTYAVVWYSNQTEIPVGKEGIFAVVDSNSDVMPFCHMLALLGKYKSAKPHNSMSFFAGQNQWFVENNFFGNIFSAGLTYLVESGIYDWWIQNGNIHKPLMQYYASHKKKFERHDKFSGNEFQSTTLEQVNVPFNLFLVMLLGSLAVFMYEFRCRLKILGQSAVNGVSLVFRNCVTYFK